MAKLSNKLNKLISIKNNAIRDSHKTVNIFKLYKNIPQSYLDFVSIFGYYNNNGQNIIGICKDINDKLYFDLEHITKSEREYNSIFNHFIPLYAVGNGDFLGIDTSQYDHKSKEAPMAYFNHEENALEKSVYPTFIDFLEDIVLRDKVDLGSII